MKKYWLIHLIPIIWLVCGILYAQSLESWAGIGFLILTLVSSAGILCGTITYHITRKIWYGILATIIATALFFGLIVLLARI